MNNMKKLSLAILIASLSACGGGSDSVDITADNGSGAPSPASSPATPPGAQPADAGTPSNGSTPPSASPNNPATPAAPAPTTPAADASNQFVIAAYQDGQKEIQLSQLALQRSADEDVREFAQLMIDQHTSMNAQITQLAQTKNIALPAALPPEHQADMSRLNGLSGDEFNRAYMQLNVAVHQKDFAAAHLQAQQGTDADVKMLAKASLPALKIHLAVAEEILSKLDPAFFLAHAYQDGLAEIQLAQLALQKSTNTAVRNFAQRMITDHTQANNQIAALAQTKNVTLPTTVPPAKQSVATELAKFSGADFDKAYMDVNVISHIIAVTLFNEQAEEGRDPEVKALAQANEPVLTEHLRLAEDVHADIQPSFLFRAYQDSEAEITLSNLALMRATDPEVKSFAQRMVTDHRASNGQIEQLAQQRNVVLPTLMSPEQLLVYADLMDRSGRDFDQNYMLYNIVIHQRDVELFTAQSERQDTDANVRAFIQASLPLLNQHLTLSREIGQRLVNDSQTTQPAPNGAPATENQSSQPSQAR